MINCAASAAAFVVVRLLLLPIQIKEFTVKCGSLSQCVCGRRGRGKRQLVGSVTGETKKQRRTRNRCNFSRSTFHSMAPLFNSLSPPLSLSFSLFNIIGLALMTWPETQCHRRARGAFGAQKATERTFEARLWSPDTIIGTSPGAARWQALVSSQGCVQ